MNSDPTDKEHRDKLQIELDFLAGESSQLDDFAPQIRVSRRARRLAVRVYPDARVEVVVPPRVRPREVEQFLNSHREWIDGKRATALARRPAPEQFPPSEIRLALTREIWRLHLGGGHGRARIAEVGAGVGGVLRVSGVASLRVALRNWLLRAARVRLEPRLAALAAAIGIRYSRMSIRRQRSRWGSCSARGTISLNACLLFQRPEVVEYLIVHELMHVKHMNHWVRFWQAVESHCPQWRALDRELLQGWRHVPRWVFSDV